MSQQINLYEARLRPRRLVLTGLRLSMAFGVVVAVCMAASVWARWRVEQVGAEALRVQTEVKALQEKHDALVRQLAEKKVPAALQAELNTVKAMVAARREAIGQLDAGMLGNTEGFSSAFRGFARQSDRDVWLTGFSVGASGQEIEIRGKLLDSTRLPAYVQRLGGDPAFQGRRFAALTIVSVDPESRKAGEATTGPSGRNEPASETGPKLPRHVEFVLRSENAGEAAKKTEGRP